MSNKKIRVFLYGEGVSKTGSFMYFDIGESFRQGSKTLGVYNYNRSGEILFTHNLRNSRQLFRLRTWLINS